jgi:nitroreductase
MTSDAQGSCELPDTAAPAREADTAGTGADLDRRAGAITDATTAAVDAAITSRRSVRAFLPTPVPRATVEQILAVAARAPSGTNTQPWRVHVLTGASRGSLSAKLCAAFDDPAAAAEHTPEYAYYPERWTSPFIERRRKVGWDLYGLLGIGRADKAGMHAQHRRNYRFFDAPVGLIFTIDRLLRAAAAGSTTACSCKA